MNERAVMVAYVDEPVEPGAVVAGSFFMWHFGDASV